MALYVSDLLTATAAPVSAAPTSTRAWQWLRGSSAISGATSSTYTAVTADIGSTLSATQLETNFLATTTATSAATEVVQAFDPIRLFSASEPGVWYDPTDISTLYQNATGTVPVTSFGQPVGLMLDKSRGLVLGPELVTNGTFDTDTDWTKGTGWTISDGAASFVGSPGSELVQTGLSFAANTTYKITFDMTQVSGGGFRFVVDTTGSFVSSYFTTTASHTLVFSVGATSTRLRLGALGGASFSIDNVSVKELPGLHATQSITASQPIYGIVPAGGRRNLLTQTEAFNEAVWVKGNSTVTANATVDPLGTTTADKLVETATSATHNLIQAGPGNATNMHSFYAKAAERSVLQIYSLATTTQYINFDLSSGTVGTVGAGTTIYAIENVGGGWYRCSVNMLSSGGGSVGYAIANSASAAWAASYTGDGTSGLFLWGAQLELGPLSPYQRVTTQYDVTEAGVASLGYLFFDGINDFMLTGTITPGTDKVQIFSGVRKLNSTTGIIAELSAIVSNAGSFLLYNHPDNAIKFGSRGSAALVELSGAASVPSTKVVTGLGDISGDTATLRFDGVQVATSTTDQGTGNYLAYPLYLGRRGGTTLEFNGHLFPLIVRFGPNLTAARIAATEAWVATKTGGVTL